MDRVQPPAGHRSHQEEGEQAEEGQLQCKHHKNKFSPLFLSSFGLIAEDQRCPGSNGRATKIFFPFLNDGLLSSLGMSVPHSFVFSNDVTLKEVWILY